MENNKRVDCPALPKGWKREEVVRKGGISAGKTDVYYYSPIGKKVRSKPELARHLGEEVDLSSFDYRAGKINPVLLREKKRHTKSLCDYKVNPDVDQLPIRQTASIFNQPVSVIKSQESQVKSELEHGMQDKPKQMFWEKRLQGFNVNTPKDECFQELQLPKNLRGSAMPNSAIVDAIRTALNIHDERSEASYLEFNSETFPNYNQAELDGFNVTDDDIRQQEDKIENARRKLQEALKDFCFD